MDAHFAEMLHPFGTIASDWVVTHDKSSSPRSRAKTASLGVTTPIEEEVKTSDERRKNEARPSRAETRDVRDIER